MTRARLAAGLAIVAWLGWSAPASAQTPAQPRTELGFGLAWTAGGAYGSTSANETTPNGGEQPLFTTTSELGQAVGVEGRLGLRLTGRLQAVLSGTWSRAELRSTASGDFEGAAPTTATIRISVFSIEGSAFWSFPRHGKWEPFVGGGAGWRRELTEDRALTGDGAIASGGGGVKYWWHEHGHGPIQRFGFRSELRLVLRSGGLMLGQKPPLLGVGATAGLIIGL